MKFLLKFVGWSCAASLVVGVIGFLVMVSGVFDIVENKYSTKAEASREGLFKRGWLPDCIPETATNISVTSNLDINTAEGSFTFDQFEADEFIRELKKRDVGAVKLGQPQEYRRLRERGYEAIYCSYGDTAWLFLIDSEEGVCKYWAGVI